MKKQFGEYYLGLDIGTDSLGWAVTDLDYNILKFNGKAMWGIRLFQKGNTAQERRINRTSRRRLARRRERIKLLQELFATEIAKIDINFFQRLNDSKFWIDDKMEHQKNTLFNDSDYTDKNYHCEYPTIYHLRSEFLKRNDIKDARLLYLAIAHILKNRGHFLFDGDNMGGADSFEQIFNNFKNALAEIDFDIRVSNVEELKQCLKEKMTITRKKNCLQKIITADFKSGKDWIGLLAGAKIKLSSLFEDETLKESSVCSISLSSGYDDDYDELSNLLQDRMIILDYAKAIFDWGVLADIKKEYEYISQAKVFVYEKHKYDLKCLKNAVKKYIPDKYDVIFKDVNTNANYVSYIGMNKKNGSKEVVEVKKVTQSDFCAFILKQFKTVENDKDSNLCYVLDELDKCTFMPKQSSKDNSVIPYQLNLAELKLILENAKYNFAFLSNVDEKGLSVCDKILMLLTFKIPYYVGPLNDAHKTAGNCWIVKKSPEKILPWTFDEIVDKEKSAEAFIRAMTNKCTYLVGEDVLPKDSILYSKFTVLNELNNVKINGFKLSVDLKQKIFTDLFMHRKKVKGKDLINYLSSNGLFDIEKDELSGFDNDFKSNMASYITLHTLLGERYSEDVAEEIIKAITLFGEDKKILKTRLKRIDNGFLSDDEIDRAARLKFSGWGSLSYALLKEIPDCDKETGEVTYMSIMDALYNTNENFMQLMSSKYGFLRALNDRNALLNEVKSFTYDSLVKDMYVSPAVKRGIWQTLCIIREIEKITGHPAKKIFVEVAREHQEDKKRTVTRKEQLLDLYKVCSKELPDLYGRLKDETDDMQLRSDKLYLYYTQLGRCMYSGDVIDIEKLMDKNIYDIDHIYPQSKVKDDSLDNRVLVKKEYNLEKSDKYPLSQNIRDKNLEFWRMLMSKGFISKKKFERLVRNSEFTGDELAGFIARQLVETRQSTKAIAKTLENVYPESEIIYVKAGNVSDFKNQFDLSKVREVNDYHHAKDAYVNIVVGNVFDLKFTKNPLNFIKNHNNEPYNMRRMFDFDVVRNGEIAWKTGKNGTIGLIKKTYNKNNILFTRHSYEQQGALFKVQPLKKGKGQMSLKSSDTRMHDIDRYGGYDKIQTAYFCLAEYEQKGKIIRSIEYVPIYLSELINKDEKKLINYLENQLSISNPKVLIPKIKINTLFCIDGFYMHISGRTGDCIIFKNAMQLTLDSEQYKYAKRVIKYCTYVTEKKKEIDADKFDTEICLQSNMLLIKSFKEKAQGAYKYKFAKLGERLNEEKFRQLSLREQCFIIKDLFAAFKCDSVHSDISVVDGDKTTGLIKLSKKINGLNSISVINQSPTGLFRTITDLTKI